MAHETDSGHREKEGMTVSLRDLGDGQSLLVFDHVVAGNLAASERVWRHKVFSTHNVYPNDRLDAMELSDQQFQEIGEVVVAHLLAINKRGK